MREAPHLTKNLKKQKQRHLYRTRRVRQSKSTSTVKYPEGTYLNFQSNNYLGLANHPKVIHACQQAAAHYGVGSTSASVVGGYTTLHQSLEEELAAFLQKPRALLFATGYLANISVFTTLASRRDTLFEDRYNHASLIAGARMAGCDLQRYQHNDIASLNTLIQQHPQTKAGIISDAVFSVNGEIAKIPELIQIAKQNNLWLMLDDAHGIGVLGESGRGTLEHLNIDPNVALRAPLPPSLTLPRKGGGDKKVAPSLVPGSSPGDNDSLIITGTFGKAFGTSGAFVAASDDIIESLIQFAKPYIYNTAPPPPMIAATLASLKIIQTDSSRRDKLQKLILYFRNQAQAFDIPLENSITPIQSIVIGDAEQAIQKKMAS